MDISPKDAFFKGFSNLEGQNVHLDNFEGYMKKLW